MINKGLFSSNSNEWATPKDLFNDLNKKFSFTLDPCANDENHKCDKYYTIKEDGLKQEWEGECVFCNPPYGREIANWVKKCYEQHIKHNITVVMLLPARTDTSYFHNYIYHKSEIIFLRGRLHFSDGSNPAPFPSMIVIYHKI